ncbi:MAG TPA: hypothetical protein VE871_19410 [Longimicrobium sp.]|nr:hypothetical protein [Longimicrobium sp.]
MRSFLRPTWTLLVLGIAGCGRPDAGGAPSVARVVLPRDMAGCYTVHDRHGGPTPDSLYFAPPRVRLHAEPASRQARDRAGGTAWALTKLDAGGRPAESRERDRLLLYWAADTLSDSVRINFNAGLSGSELIVLPRPAPADTIRGRAVEHWDMGPPFTTEAGPVTMIRIACVPESTAP